MKTKDYDLKKHISLSKEKTFIKSYDCVEDAELSNSEKKLLNLLISFGENKKRIFQSVEYFTERLGLDVRTLRSALRNFQLRGLIKVVRETGKRNEIILNKEWINRFLGSEIFQVNTPNVNKEHRTGGIPTKEMIDAYYGRKS